MKPGSSDGILTLLASLAVSVLLFGAQALTRSTSSSSNAVPDSPLHPVDARSWMEERVSQRQQSNNADTTQRTTRLDDPFRLPDSSSVPLPSEVGMTRSRPASKASNGSTLNAGVRGRATDLPGFSSPDRTAGAPGTRTFRAESKAADQEDSTAAHPDGQKARTESATESGLFQVIGVIDGDTVDLLVNGRPQRLRLNGIDTPEKGQPFGNTAKQKLFGAIGGRSVRYVVRDTDRYGRSIADIYYQGIHVNAWLVQQGLAWHYKAYNNDAQLAALEIQARKASRGLWADPRRVAPWNWRKLSKVERDQYR